MDPGSRPEKGTATERGCAMCGATYDGRAWQDLALLQRIEAAEVRRLIRDWPEGAAVEVRACRRCENLIAAKVLPDEPGS
jgi:RNA polymerase subunit RPABC4/transcription elongation factor Spt4